MIHRSSCLFFFLFLYSRFNSRFDNYSSVGYPKNPYVVWGSSYLLFFSSFDMCAFLSLYGNITILPVCIWNIYYPVLREGKSILIRSSHCPVKKVWHSLSLPSLTSFVVAFLIKCRLLHNYESVCLESWPNHKWPSSWIIS